VDPIRIVLVEDNEVFREALELLLGLRADLAVVASVGDGTEAVPACREHAPDVILMDFRMPGLDGGELLAEVRRWRPQTARLILSGHTAEKDLMRVATIAHQFLTKPCDADNLVQAVERALRLRHQIADERLRSELTSVTAIPSSPGVLQELIEILPRPGIDARAVAAVIQQDIGLTAKVLQLVNSSFFALRSRITSLETAVARLGIQTLRSLLLRDDLLRPFEIPDGVSADWVALLNAHAVETAQLARRLAAPDSRNDAFCGALLLECGQLAFAVCRPAAFASRQKFQEHEGRAPSGGGIEAATFGVSHAQAGAYLLSLWGFPDEIVQAVAHPGAASVPDTCDRPGLGAAGAIQLAHQLVESESISLCRGPVVPTMPDDALASAGVLEEVKAWRARRSPAGKEQVA
jgi:HD-like signal output (HDOD) protein